MRTGKGNQLENGLGAGKDELFSKFLKGVPFTAQEWKVLPLTEGFSVRKVRKKVETRCLCIRPLQP